MAPDGSTVRLQRAGEQGAVLVELPMPAHVFGRLLQILGAAGFELVDDGGDVAVSRDGLVSRG